MGYAARMNEERTLARMTLAVKYDPDSGIHTLSPQGDTHILDDVLAHTAEQATKQTKEAFQHRLEERIRFPLAMSLWQRLRCALFRKRWGALFNAIKGGA